FSRGEDRGEGQLQAPEPASAPHPNPLPTEEWGEGTGRSKSMRILICGGGVIGASIAYYLSCRGAEAIVIERTGVACAASGKSGGFLALDWCDGTRLEPLARRSFALHARLGQEIDGDGAIAASHL